MIVTELLPPPHPPSQSSPLHHPSLDPSRRQLRLWRTFTSVRQRQLDLSYWRSPDTANIGQNYFNRLKIEDICQQRGDLSPPAKFRISADKSLISYSSCSSPHTQLFTDFTFVLLNFPSCYKNLTDYSDGTFLQFISLVFNIRSEFIQRKEKCVVTFHFAQT